MKGRDRALLAWAAVILPVVASLPARAEDEACRRGISVTGRAHAIQAPDFAEVTIGVEARAGNAAAALDVTSKGVAGIVALGRDLGIPAGDVGTAAVVLEPATRTVTRPNGTSQDEPDGYRASNRVTVRLADMGRLGDLLRRALEAGANRIDSIGFGLTDPDRVEAALQVEAARNARTQAASLAEAVGAHLGGLCSLSTSRTAVPMAMQASRAAAAPKRVPIEAGTIGSSAEVTATFAIER
ncbi:SIMPL domain-containing protein [Methylobacterium sp. HMF5984]|uniref:SIMPL domain-containing protein n=1 Tax=Methylobacterium sp. HMF5984 TaxID=3367370 RepID=UPI0038531492